MSVDHYICDACGRTFADCNWDAAYCDCGGRFCSKKCCQKDGADNCCLCRMEVVRDEDLLSFLLKQFKLTREQAIALYKNGK